MPIHHGGRGRLLLKEKKRFHLKCLCQSAFEISRLPWPRIPRMLSKMSASSGGTVGDSYSCMWNHAELSDEQGNNTDWISVCAWAAGEMGNGTRTTLCRNLRREFHTPVNMMELSALLCVAHNPQVLCQPCCSERNTDVLKGCVIYLPSPMDGFREVSSLGCGQNLRERLSCHTAGLL